MNIPEAFAVVKNAARRLVWPRIIVREHPLKWECVHFDVQLIGGVGVAYRHIAEMATVRSKTLSNLARLLKRTTGRAFMS